MLLIRQVCSHLLRKFFRVFVNTIHHNLARGQIRSMTPKAKDCIDKIVRLNVEGTPYDVSGDTLKRCEGSMLANLISGQWKEGTSGDKEPIFIDRNGRLFEYILDYLRTNRCHLPPSVSRAAVKEEFKYYGIDADIRHGPEQYDCNYFQEVAEEFRADIFQRNQIAAVNAAKKSAQVEDEIDPLMRELVFFLMIETYKINPSPGKLVSIRIPHEYIRIVNTSWIQRELRDRGFELSHIPRAASFISIGLKSDEKT